MKIEGCVALVTGANRGLGKALVDALLQAGAAKVWAAARDVGAITATDPRVARIALDTTNKESVARAAQTASDVTLLVNNAGVASAFNVLTLECEALQRDFGTNVHGTLGVIKAFDDLKHAATGSEAKVMAGIAEALTATAIGLLVAIPAVVAFNYFSRRLKVVMGGADEMAHAVLAAAHASEREPR